MPFNDVTASDTKGEPKLEETMRGMSRWVSLIGLGLMAIGLVDFIVNQRAILIPGDAVIRLDQLLDPSRPGVGLWAMSTGIVLFALLPLLRVMLALWTFGRRRNWLNTLAALIVFLELLFSMRAGG